MSWSLKRERERTQGHSQTWARLCGNPVTYHSYSVTSQVHEMVYEVRKMIGMQTLLPDTHNPFTDYLPFSRDHRTGVWPRTIEFLLVSLYSTLKNSIKLGFQIFFLWVYMVPLNILTLKLLIFFHTVGNSLTLCRELWVGTLKILGFIFINSNWFTFIFFADRKHCDESLHGYTFDNKSFYFYFTFKCLSSAEAKVLILSSLDV